MKKILFIYFSLAVLLFSSVGKIAVTKGDVSVLRDGETIAVSSGFELMEKDRIITGTGARAQLVFNDETVVSVGKGSEFLVQEYLFEAGAGPDAQKASFQSVKGAFKTITGQIGKVAPDKFKLATKTATIGIRGTHFLGKISIDGDKIACTHGAISVAAFAGGEPVVVPAGQITTVLSGQMPSPPRKYSATELNEMNEASGSVTQEEEAAPEATTEEGEGEDGTAQAQAEEQDGGEVEVGADEPIETETPPLIAGIPAVPLDSPIPKEILPEIPTKPDYNPDVPSSFIPTLTSDGYPLTYIQASGPIDLYGKEMGVSMGMPDCANGECDLSTDTSWANYFYSSAIRFLRDGTYIAANEDGTGDNLGYETRYDVYPALGFQSFLVENDNSEDAQGYLGQMGTTSGVAMMSTALENYEGYNLEYNLGSDGTEHDYISYDNLGEFAIVTSSTVDPVVSGEMYQSMIYMGKKSSWTDFLAGDIPNHLIYKLLVINNVGYDATTQDFYSSYYNGLETGTDYSNSRVIGNTHNGNVLYVSRANDNGMGWGVVVGQVGGTESILFDGYMNLWAHGEKDENGYYYLDSEANIEGIDNAVIEGELYGSQLQGFGLSLTSGSAPSVFADNPPVNPTSFDATLVAGYRTDDAGAINLDTPLTGTATMSGFTTSKVFVDGSGLLYMGQIGMTLDRDTGDISGTITLGEDRTNPNYSVTIDGSGGTTSAFISDDYFTSILTGATDYYGSSLTPDFASGTAGGFMATHSGFALDDVTWGYWVASYGNGSDIFHHKSAWVAGIDTDASVLASLKSNAEVYTYDGKILGRVYGNGPSGNINSDASWVRIAVDFGSTSPVSGSMAFSVIEYPELVWYANIDSTGSTFDESSGAMLALLSGNANSVVKIGADPYGSTTDAGGLNADLYGSGGT